MDARPILSRRAVLAGLRALVAGGLLVGTAGPALAASLHGSSTSTPLLHLAAGPVLIVPEEPSPADRS